VSITVAIYINGKTIFSRSAVNKSGCVKGINKYLVDDGSVIEHNREDGAVPLAIAMLNTIKEPK
jgi:hypothetical protein